MSRDSPASTITSAAVEEGNNEIEGLITQLTPRQEERLRTYLDDKLSILESDEKTNNLGSIPSLVKRLSILLQIILQIPPKPPFSSLRISYLLTLTAVIPLYITSLTLLSSGHRTKSDAEREAEGSIREVLDILREVENGWKAVLNGQAWLPPRSSGGRKLGGRGVKVDFGGQVDTTERIRLKSIIISSRSRLIAWSRTYGNFEGSSIRVEQNEASIANEFVATKALEGVRKGGWEEEMTLMWNDLLDILSRDLA
ncbi:uncharacterized protein IL334_002536 [Kwoniella shivajii]|uniref:Uncharacterized protein n=1 Tax=Kwoniella shivajii TaxID=564305 RepID=A0ABZ1CV04_9TREE|nr:hypothetical protein IL334_002536 [Kwoniella shivajii]